MASKVELVVEVKSPADKLWAALRDSTELFPKIFPEQYKSIETVEGDGKSAGTVRLLKYTEGTYVPNLALRSRRPPMGKRPCMHVSAIAVSEYLYLSDRMCCSGADADVRQGEAGGGGRREQGGVVQRGGRRAG